eukprot:SAG25_NODE_567_length_6885_cov_9.281757_8_plen_105_part_00
MPVTGAAVVLENPRGLDEHAREHPTGDRHRADGDHPLEERAEVPADVPARGGRVLSHRARKPLGTATQYAPAADQVARVGLPKQAAVRAPETQAPCASGRRVVR